MSMTEEEFCNYAVGKPWKNRAEGPIAFDCWGLVLDSYRKIDGIELPAAAGYADKNCPTSEAAKSIDMENFTLCQPTNGAIMAVFDNKDNLLHVGRCLCGRVLHATRGLGVRLDTYQSINNKHRNVRYFKYG